MEFRLDAATTLPADAESACLIGRAWVPGSPAGPSVVVVAGGDVVDISRIYPTTSQLLDAEHPAVVARAAAAQGTPLGRVADVLANTAADACDPRKPYLLAPCDLQALKALLEG